MNNTGFFYYLKKIKYWFESIFSASLILFGIAFFLYYFYNYWVISPHNEFALTMKNTYLEKSWNSVYFIGLGIIINHIKKLCCTIQKN